jgi:hypothetical protein
MPALSAYQPLVLGERNVCFLSWWWQTKLPPNEFTTANTKGPWSETRCPMIGGAGVSLARFICLDWAQ